VTESTPVIAARQLTVAYGGRTVVDAADLIVSAGERVALVGPNGAGKSSLLRAVTGVLTPRTGSVELLGEPIDRIQRKTLARMIAVVPEVADLPFAMPVEEVVALGRLPHEHPIRGLRPADRAAVAAAIDRVGVGHLLGRDARELSLGERQLVLLAMAIAQEAPVLVLDEPMAGLDPRGRKELLELLIKLQAERELTLIVCSASLTDASLLCDRFIVLDRGTVVMDGPVREVLRKADRLAELDITLPEPVVGAREMQKLFPDFPTDLLTEDELVSELLTRLETT
jgi:ABC-type cobalamin/Fe3+-siderophores transport system ATPase subunit